MLDMVLGGGGGKMGEADVNADGSLFTDGSRFRGGLFYFTGERDIPVRAFLENCRFFEGAFDVSGLVEFNPADFGEEDAGVLNFDSLGKTKAFVLSFFLEPGVAGLLTLLGASKEVGEGAVEVFEGLLEDLAVDLF